MKKRIPGFDGVRALAVIAVVWHHTRPGFWLPASHNGFLGVDVFFVLSGFLITTLLLEEQACSAISLSHFYIRRSLRIFPLYYAVLALLACYFTVSGGSQRTVFLQELPYHLGYISNWLHLNSIMAITWSLSTEEQFYLVWPPLLAWLGARALWPLGVFLVLNQAVNFGLLDGVFAAVGLPYQSAPILQVTFTPILLGVILAFMLRSPLRAYLERINLPVAVGLLLVIVNIPGDFRGWPRLLFHLTSAAVLAGIILRPSSIVVRALEWRPIAYVGTVSYGIYLLHKLTLDAALRVLGKIHISSPDVLFVLSLLGSIAIAGASFKYFETPFLRLGRRYRRKVVDGNTERPHSVAL